MSGRIVSIDGRPSLLPFPVAMQVEAPGGTLLVLQCPIGVASPVSIVKLSDAGKVEWTAEPCAWPPQHDPYVDVAVDDGRIHARSASGWLIELDAASGAGTLAGRSEQIDPIGQVG